MKHNISLKSFEEWKLQQEQGTGMVGSALTAAPQTPVIQSPQAPTTMNRQDLGYNLNKITQAASHEQFKKQYPTFYREMNKLSANGRAEFFDLVQNLMGQTKAWGATTQKKFA